MLVLAQVLEVRHTTATVELLVQDRETRQIEIEVVGERSRKRLLSAKYNNALVVVSI